jgi:signal transduction histidine kinase
LKEIQRRKDLEKQMVNLLERDRKQIGRALHDEVGQVLATLHMELDLLKQESKSGPEEIRKTVEGLQQRVKTSVSYIRDISRWLRSDILDKLGLEAALRDLAQMGRLDDNMHLHLSIRKIPENLQHETGLAVFRIVQESLTNVFRHANAKNVFVTVVKKNSIISISVEDDGTGFKTNERKGIPTLGLMIMKERAEQAGGRLWIESKPGKGTHVLGEIPV